MSAAAVAAPAAVAPPPQEAAPSEAVTRDYIEVLREAIMTQTGRK